MGASVPMLRSLLDGAARHLAFVAILCASAVFCGGSIGAPTIQEKDALRVSQAAIGRLVGDHAFVTSDHQRVHLAEYRGRPLVVSLVYTGCADICPMVSEALAEAVDVAQDALGSGSFRVITVGFDTRNDTPSRMRAFARSHGLKAENWHFVSADGDTIDRLAEDLGFLFYAAPQGFDHLSQTSVLDSDGRVYRQVYGASFEPQLLVEPLKDLVFGRRSDLTSWSGLLNQVRLVCTIYDPATGRYSFDYSFIAMITGGALSLCTIAVVIVRSWLHSRGLNRT